MQCLNRCEVQSFLGVIQKVVIHWENNLNCRIIAGMKNDEILALFTNVHMRMEIQANTPYVFIRNNSQLPCSGVQNCKDMYRLSNANGSLMRVCVYSWVCLKQLKPNFTWNHHGKREENLFK